jgi:hypothetical protein
VHFAKPASPSNLKADWSIALLALVKLVPAAAALRDSGRVRALAKMPAPTIVAHQGMPSAS